LTEATFLDLRHVPLRLMIDLFFFDVELLLLLFDGLENVLDATDHDRFIFGSFLVCFKQMPQSSSLRVAPCVYGLLETYACRVIWPSANALKENISFSG
jgi:hypothetical protein